MTLTEAEIRTLISALDGLHQPVIVPIQAMVTVLTVRAKLAAELDDVRAAPPGADPAAP